MVSMSDDMIKYFQEIDKKIDEMYTIARRARKKNIDPVDQPETNVASDIAGRVEELVGPKGIAKKIRDLSKIMGRDSVAFKIADEIVNSLKDKDMQEAADLAIRCALAIKTEGVVSAPLEGISEIKIKNDFSGLYLSISFAGPIRAAGGTTQAYVVLLADHIRKILGLDKFTPTKEEIARYVEEIHLYDRIVNLQYPSTPEELEWIVSNVPIEVTGDPTNQEEVSAHRDLNRVETNCVRGGACLVLNDGVLSKSKKLLKLIDELKIEGWDWLKKIPHEKPNTLGDEEQLESDKKFGDDLFQEEEIQEENDELFQEDDYYQDEQEKKKHNIEPKSKYIAEVIAGRPIFSHPSNHGGFRIRYGRSRNMGLAGYGFHPATMFLTDNFMAVGTQLRVERPGKSTVAMPVDSIEGPVVRLKNGSVMRIETIKQVQEFKKNIDQVLFLGDVLIGFGEFLENNHVLVASPYCEEWWILQVNEAMKEKGFDSPALARKLGVDGGTIDKWLNDHFYEKPDSENAVKLSKVLGVPLHPRYVYFWNGITVEQLKMLRNWLKEHSSRNKDEHGNEVLTCKKNEEIKGILERSCIPHDVEDEGYNFKEESHALIETLALDKKGKNFKKNGRRTLKILNELSDVEIKDKAPHFMGTRMGRPEKAKERKMNPPVHVLFPIGHDSGSQRVIQDALKKKKVKVDVANKICYSCKQTTFLNYCPKCKGHTEFYKTCPKCKKYIKKNEETCQECGLEGQLYSSKEINLIGLYHDALKKVNLNVPKVKGIKGMSSKFKVPEPLEKGLLRAKFDVYTYKDGTMRFDTGDCPLTHFTPREIFTRVEDLVELGYTHDIKGEPLTDSHQILELKVQDILLPKSSLDYLVRESKFIDELLQKVYGLPPYYNITKARDFLGHLTIGLAPHTSAGVVGRIIGFTTANVGYAHPTYHAAKRRNCDGDEDGILLFMDVILNFSRHYLPSRIGAKMDTPLVISNRVVPEEVDSEAHNVDTSWFYPLEFYERTQEYPGPKDVANLIETVKQRLGTNEQYEKMGFTHPTSNINHGPKVTAYKELNTMEDKIVAQFNLAKKLAAVDQVDQAKRVIQAHFTPDILGNLRAFSTQTFRCTKCNTKYRRPPLKGKCKKCGNDGLVLTVSPGSIKKYLDLALRISKEYDLSSYTQQRIKIMAEKVESTVFNGTKKQMTLAQFF
ncbi:MAG: DNA polymerase II large subunit [Candidatus Hodarchaeota archaeon]